MALNHRQSSSTWVRCTTHATPALISHGLRSFECKVFSVVYKKDLCKKADLAKNFDFYPCTNRTSLLVLQISVCTLTACQFLSGELGQILEFAILTKLHSPSAPHHTLPVD